MEIPFEVRPSHILTSVDGIADNVGVVSYEAGQHGHVLVGVGADKRPNRRFWIRRFDGVRPHGPSHRRQEDKATHYEDHYPGQSDLLLSKGNEGTQKTGYTAN